MIGNSLSRDIRLNGIDLSFEMCRKAQLKLAKRDRYDFLIVSADAQNLPFAKDNIDIVFISFMLEILPSPIMNDVIGNFHDHLKKEGQLCVVNIEQKSWKNMLYAVYKWMNKLFPKIVDCRPINSSEYIKENGFKIIEREIFSMWGIPAAIILAQANR